MSHSHQDPAPTLAGLSSALSQGRTTAAKIVSNCLNSIDAANNKLAAFVAIASDAMAQANQSDHRRRIGWTLGPLDGIPFAVKDLFDVAGLPTLGGSRSRSTVPATKDSEPVKRLREAGMIPVGKTATVEFGCGGWGTQSATPVPWNPWCENTHCVPGGSSSGSAVAVAAGLVPFALGSDTGGSVRIPAAYCGIVGFKPSRGLVPLTGVLPYSQTHDTVGLLAASVQDVSYVFATLAGSARPAGDQDWCSLRVAEIDDIAMGACDADVEAEYHNAITCIAALGCHTTQVTLPESINTYSRLAGHLALREAFENYGAAIAATPDLFGKIVKSRILNGGNTPPLDTMKRERQDRGQRFAEVSKDFDILISPTCPTGAIPVDQVDEEEVSTPFVRLANYLDLPAISIPIGYTGNGMPVGLQLMAKPGDDWRLLAFANALMGALVSEGRRCPPLSSYLDFESHGQAANEPIDDNVTRDDIPASGS